MKTARSWGFTLIELLTVIAIIAILAAMTAVVLPKVLERAKIARTETDMNAVRQALASYYTSNGSYPPAYGYRTWITREIALDPIADAEAYFWHTLYADLPGVNLRDNFDLYDEWSDSYDTDNDGLIQHLEFDPIAGETPPFYDEPFANANGFDALTGAKNRDTARPYVYIPVNKAQAAKVRRYYETQNDFRAISWDPSNQILSTLVFPPPRYDAFVVISVGPENNTCGIVDPPPGVLAGIKAALNDIGLSQDLYHVLALRAYYLATRDLNNNGLLDYDFRSRSRQNEGKPDAFPGFDAFEPYLMPITNLNGPLILAQEG